MSKKIYHQFKCSAMMLPEHREMLKNNFGNNVNEVENILTVDEQQLEEFDIYLNQSLQNKDEIVLYLKSPENFSDRLRGIVKEKNAPYNFINLFSEGKSVLIDRKNILKIEKN